MWWRAQHRHMKIVLNMLVAFIILGVSGVTGHLLAWIGGVFVRYFSDQGLDLPVITTFCLAYAKTPAPIIVGWGFGLFLMVISIGLISSEKAQRAVPYLAVLMCLIPMLQLMLVSFAMAVPFMKVVSMIRE